MWIKYQDISLRQVYTKLENKKRGNMYMELDKGINRERKGQDGEEKKEDEGIDR